MAVGALRRVKGEEHVLHSSGRKTVYSLLILEVWSLITCEFTGNAESRLYSRTSQNLRFYQDPWVICVHITVCKAMLYGR